MPCRMSLLFGSDDSSIGSAYIRHQKSKVFFGIAILIVNEKACVALYINRLIVLLGIATAGRHRELLLVLSGTERGLC